MKSFNTTGPCDPRKHYMIDAMRRLGKEVFSLIDAEQYFVIHAARQSGKTTLLMGLTKQINNEGKFRALYCSLENLQTTSDAAIGIPAIIDTLEMALAANGFPNAESFSQSAQNRKYQNALQSALTEYSRNLDKPLIVFFDESDCLSGATLISFLRQLRSGYINRVNIPFVHSAALVGTRNIRDYRDEYRLPEQTLGSGSPFNIAKRHMTLRNFTRDEITELYAQHTRDTGQIFEPDAIDLTWEKTQGQPWLVNAIACEIVENITRKALREESFQPVTANMVSEAIQTLILRRDTHFDSLIARLREGRARRIIEPVLIGEIGDISQDSDDYGYVKDLGLIRDDRGKIEPANPIYGEVIARALNGATQMEMEQRGGAYQIPRYLKGGVVDMDFLLSDFQEFWRENSGIWQEKYEYKEAAPHLILQAFLQRILNGGGQIIREFAAAAGRVDLCVIYLKKKYPIEMKIRYGDHVYAEGVTQTLAYMDTLGCDKGWLVVFDRRKTLAWDERLFVRKERVNKKIVTIYGC